LSAVVLLELNCARKLPSHSDVRITLIDKDNYQQFQPLNIPSWLKMRLAIRPHWKANYDAFEGSGVAAQRAWSGKRPSTELRAACRRSSITKPLRIGLD
jgi:hypothetical protein